MTIEPNYVPAWPCPDPSQLTARSADLLPYPLSATDKLFFYVARNAIYHLFRALALGPNDHVLMPNYHSGNETAAVRAAGAAITWYPIRRDLQPDFDALERLCSSTTRALYVIHFMGWPQPLHELASFCRRKGLVMIEDCALAMLSEYRGRPVGSYGDYSVFCLYKTLSLPNGGVVVRNNPTLPAVGRHDVHRPGSVAMFGRCSELIIDSIRCRFPFTGAVLAQLKATVGRLLTGVAIDRARVGNIGFDIRQVNIGMSPICHALLCHFDYEHIVVRRRFNYMYLSSLLADRPELLPLPFPEGVCPLFLPIVVRDKHAVVEDLRRRGVGAVELWNTGDSEAATVPGGADAMFLRRHVVELPIHQALTEKHLRYIARQVHDVLDRSRFSYFSDRPVEADPAVA